MIDWSGSLYRLCSGLAVSTVIIVMHALGACSSGIDASRDSETAPAGVSKSTSSEALLNGTIAYMRPMAIPRDAMVEVSLLDLTDAASPVVVAEQRFRAARQAPIGFDLPYASSRIARGHVYGLRARILVDGALWFVNEQPAPVLTGGHPSVAQILVRPAAEGRG
ncbi:MAG: YbaY family lipoprotein [Rhodoplanes sp.]